MAMVPKAVPAAISAVVVEDLDARGIYKFHEKVEGCDAYFAWNRRREMIGRGLRVHWPGESLDDIFAELSRELRERDPVRPAYIKLVAREYEAPTKKLTLREALDLETIDFARWLYQ